MIDTDKYEGHTKEKWCARNVGDGSLISCDEDYDHDIPFMETGEWSNPAIGYLAAGHEAHSLEERRANIKLMADAPLLLQEVKRLREEEVFTKALVLDKIMEWHKRMQLQGEGIAHRLDRMNWLLKNPTKKYEDYDEVNE